MKKPTFLYNLRSEGDHFIITKHNADENCEVVSLYHLHPNFSGGLSCDCPRGQAPTCRHRKMFPIMRDRADTGWFLDFDGDGNWHDPFDTEGEFNGPVDITDEEAIDASADTRFKEETNFLKGADPKPITKAEVEAIEEEDERRV